MSETDFLKLKKHDNPETNTEKFDIENYLNGNWDKIDKNVGEVNTNISNINSKNKEQDTNIEQLQENTETSSNKIAELEKELKEAQEDFYQNSIRGQASGEYIHVEDSSNCRAKIGIGGNSEQETRSGKNCIPNNLIDGTTNGIKYTIDSDKAINLSGTATARTEPKLFYNTTNPLKFKAGTYKNTSDLLIILRCDTYISIPAKSTVVLSEDKEVIEAYFRIEQGETVSGKHYPQIIVNGQDESYEQYGAMPSPNYPSKVQTVGSNVNIFDGEIEKGGINYQNGNVESATDRIRSKNFIEVDPNFQYTINRLDSNGKGLGIRGYDKDKNYVGYIGANTNKTITFIPQTYSNTDMPHPNTKFYYMKFIDLDNNLNARYKIEKGIVATGYSEHGQGCVKVTKCNKNLFPALKSQSKENKGITFSYNASTQEFSAKGTTTDTLFYTTLTFEELKYLSKDKKYILSISNLMPTKCKVALTKINVIDNGIINEGKKQTTVDNLDKYKPDGFMFYGQNLEKGTKIDFTFKAQIEEGSTATSLIQHEEQSYIMPTQTEMLENDYLDYDNEEEVHVWGKKILTGDEGWRMPSSNDTNAVFTNLSNTDFCDFKSDTAIQYCNYFKYKGIAQGFASALNKGVGIYAFYSVNKYEYFVAPKTIASSVDEWKAYLKSQYDAGTPVVVYYQLATPTRLKFTDEQKAVAKELNNARTYKNVTNITTDSKAILSLDYAKDLETLLTSKESEV